LALCGGLVDEVRLSQRRIGIHRRVVVAVECWAVHTLWVHWCALWVGH